MSRSQDPRITDRALEAALTLLAEQGFAALSMEAVAARAGVGKPALYRRFAGKAELAAAAIATALPEMAAAAPDDAQGLRAHVRHLVEQALPADPEGYAALLGALMAERRRHPELIDAFRRHVLLPRRAVVRTAVEQGQRSGVLRADLDPELAVDLLGGPFVARAFAGLDMPRRWRDELFERWWEMARA